jgi:transcription initiation factor TFIIB
MQMKQEILERSDWQQCPLCRGKIVLDIESGENICNGCGLVVGRDLVIPDATGGDFATKRDATTIAPPNHVGQTFIDRRNVDSRGKKIDMADNMYMMRRLDFQASAENSDRSFRRALQEITRITERLGIGSTVQREAMSIYCKASEKDLIRGRSVDGICTAAIYVACRKLSVPRLLQDIIEVASHEDRKHIAPYSKLLFRQLGIHAEQLNAAEYVDYVARNARISSRTQRMALSLLTIIERNPKLSGKRPISIAAAALYLASKKTGENTSQLRIAGATNLTPTTVRKTAADIEEVLLERKKEREGLVDPSPHEPQVVAPATETVGEEQGTSVPQDVSESRGIESG